MAAFEHSVPDCQSDLAAFHSALAETIAWAQSRIDPMEPDTCLNAAQIDPPRLLPTYFDTVRYVVESRRSALVLSDMPPGTNPGNLILAGGRLLAFFPDANLDDGAAEAASNGFFDVHNTPPVGTWVGAFRDDTGEDRFRTYLVAWIPEEFQSHVSEGIEVNPERCIQWLADTNTRLKQQLG